MNETVDISIAFSPEDLQALHRALVFSWTLYDSWQQNESDAPEFVEQMQKAKLEAQAIIERMYKCCPPGFFDEMSFLWKGVQ